MNNIPKSLQSIDLKSVLRRQGIYSKQRAYKELKENLKPVAQKMLKKKEEVVVPRRHAQFTNEQVNAYWEKQIHIVETVERVFENKVEQFITHVEKSFLSHLDQEIGSRKSFIKFVNKDWFGDNEEELLVKAQFDFTPLLENVAVLSGNQANKLIGINDPYLPYNYRSKIIENVTKFTQSLLSTDRDALVNLITNGLEQGLSVPEIRTSITETFDTFSKTQSQRITRTEVLRVSNQASIDAYEQSGVVEGKQWLTAGAVDECAEYDGDIVYELDGNFYSDTSEFKDGDPPLHPNCRCVVLPVVVGTKGVEPDNTKLYERVKELEAQVDKRTKQYKEVKDLRADDQAYIKALEGLVNE